MSDTIRIDPRDFIMGPFLTCPKCGKPEFGVLDVSDTRCQRRCRACLCMKTVYLPELKKKIVYIDQSAISNIMKVLSPEVKGHERTASEPFWNELFQTLSVVCKLQLVVCPDSREHEYESLTSSFYTSLKRTYEYFSAGVTFDDAESIRQHQVTRIALCWLRKEQAQFVFDPQDVTHGNVHGWSARIRVTAHGELPGMVEHLRTVRDQAHSGLERVFKKWQQDKKTFKEVFEVEKRSYRDNLIAGYNADLQRQAQMAALILKGGTPSLDDIMPSPSKLMVTALRSVFESEVAPDELSATMAAFLGSEEINEATFNMIQSAMWASLAWKAAAGQREVPNQGTFTDVNVVSTLLPYCDAMFVDNKCRALLEDIPREHKLPLPCAVFSLKTGGEFIRYLQQIRDSATPEHLKLIEEVYGSDPLKPHSGIYGIGKFRRADEK